MNKRADADSFAWGPTDVLCPPSSLPLRLARRIASETGTSLVLPSVPRWDEPEWEQMAPGVFCKLMASDSRTRCASMLVRLLPGVEYPPHTPAGLEELFVLDGEVWVDDRKLYPGDYERVEVGSDGTRVWSETGCTCVLVTTMRGLVRL